jgi:hypothetical protein
MFEVTFQLVNAEVKFLCHSQIVRLKYFVERNNNGRVSRLLVQDAYFGLSSDANLEARQTTGHQRPLCFAKLPWFLLDGA